MIRPKSVALFKRAQKALVGGVNSPVRAFRAVGGTPIFFKRARGAFFWDADGRRYLDYVGSWGPMILGHGDPAVSRAARRAINGGSSFGAPTESEVRLAELVRAAFPSMEKVRMVSSGTEACMTALRLARGATKRDLIVKFSGCYHGHSDGLLVAAGSGALTLGHPDSRGVPKAQARLTLVLPYNDRAALEKAFRRYGRSIAAAIVEPAAGNMGLVPPGPGFLRLLRERTKRAGSLLIFDEVITGFRLAFGGAQALYRIKPDLTCLGKILGGGFPVGALGGPAALMDLLAPLGPVYQAGTLSGNPVAMAAGSACLSELKRRDPYRVLEERAASLAAGLKGSARKRNLPVTVNQLGSLLTVFFTDGPVTDLRSAQTSDVKRYGKFFHGLLEEGIYFPPGQFEAAFVSCRHTPDLIEKTVRSADKVFRSL